MPYKDPEKQKEYFRLYRQRPEVKEKVKQRSKEWHEKNKEHCKQLSKQWYRNNREYELKKNKLYRENHKLYYSLKDKEYNRKRKLGIVFHYSKGKMCCNDCGETIIELLTLNHINGGGHKHTKKLAQEGTRLYQWIITKNYPPGFNILCIRCNWLKGKVTPERYQEILNEIKNRKALTC